MPVIPSNLPRHLTVELLNGLARCTSVCPFCGMETIFDITIDQLNRFVEGGVMNVLDLDADHREWLKTGICNQCWGEL